MPRRVYSPAQRIEGVARVLAGESIEAAALSLGIPRTCLSRWVTEHNLIAVGRSQAALTAVSHTARVEPIVTIAEAATRRGLRNINRGFDQYEDDTLPIRDRPRLRDIAYATDIAHTAHLDYRDGRKGAEIHVDARTQTLALPPGATVADLRALLAESEAGLLARGGVETGEEGKSHGPR